MDPLTHTLTGATLARAGLAHRTPLATATLLIAANLPDLDVLSYLWGPEVALTFRRGWTHGLPALALWPCILTGVMLAWDRGVRRRRRPAAPPARAAALLLVAAIGVATHPALDWLNVYGMRWLMPFDGRWFYGDALFIVDPYVWLVLGGGWLLAGRARRRGRHGVRTARAALALAASYALVMLGLAVRAERAVRTSLTARGAEPGRVMAGPEPLRPLARWIVAEVPGGYLVGPGSAPPGELTRVPSNAGTADARWVAGTVPGARFLQWARFPVFQAAPDRVSIVDVRYALEADVPFGAVTVWRRTPPSR